jgi:hypothetical protein
MAAQTELMQMMSQFLANNNHNNNNPPQQDRLVVSEVQSLHFLIVGL